MIPDHEGLMGRWRVVINEHERVGQYVCEKAGGEWGCTAKAIGVERGGQLVGGVIFDNYNGASVCIHVGSDGSRRWLSREFLRIIFLYAFEQMRVKKIIGPVPASNQRALAFDKRIGFVDEGIRVPEAAPDGGDLVLLTMTRAQCRWI